MEDITNDALVFRQQASGNKQLFLSEMRGKLDEWLTDLPTDIRYNRMARSPASPPVLYLHIQYWVTVIVLHRR